MPPHPQSRRDVHQHHVIVRIVLAAFAVAASGTFCSIAHAQYLGAASCAGAECHNPERDWLTSRPGGQEHNGSLGKLRQARENSEKYAKAVNLANFEDPKGMCVKCHATFVEKAQTLTGVGCEGCHGAAAGYRPYHSQNPKDYSGAVKDGMRNLRTMPVRWIMVCKDCHVLDKKPEYDALIEAGHKDNARWNVSRKYEGVSAHWKKVKYTVAMIADAMAGKAVTPTVAVDPAPTPGPASTSPPTTTPPPTPPPTPTTPAATAPPASKSSVPAPTKPQPIPAKPAPADRGKPVVQPQAPPQAVPTSAPVVSPPKPADPDPPPMPPMMPMGPMISSPLELTMPPPTTPAGLIASLQDRVAGILDSLLRKNVVPPVPLRPPDFSTQIAGPDAEFLRLQADALALAVEALNLRVKSPPVSRPPGQSPNQ